MHSCTVKLVVNPFLTSSATATFQHAVKLSLWARRRPLPTLLIKLVANTPACIIDSMPGWGRKRGHTTRGGGQDRISQFSPILPSSAILLSVSQSPQRGESTKFTYICSNITMTGRVQYWIYKFVYHENNTKQDSDHLKPVLRQNPKNLDMIINGLCDGSHQLPPILQSRLSVLHHILKDGVCYQSKYIFTGPVSNIYSQDQENHCTASVPSCYCLIID